MDVRILMDVTSEKQRKETLIVLGRYFPDWAELIEREYGTSQDFRALCDDFQVCDTAREKWEESDAPNAPERRLEYAEWSNELLQEIEDWLKQSVTTSDPA